MPWLITDRLVGLVTPLFLALHQLRVWKSLSANENLQMGSHVLPGAGGLLKGLGGNGSQLHAIAPAGRAHLPAGQADRSTRGYQQDSATPCKPACIC